MWRWQQQDAAALFGRSQRKKMNKIKVREQTIVYKIRSEPGNSGSNVPQIIFFLDAQLKRPKRINEARNLNWKPLDQLHFF